MRQDDGIAELILGIILGMGVGLGATILVIAVLFDVFPI
jgi:hypothetical protein